MLGHQKAEAKCSERQQVPANVWAVYIIEIEPGSKEPVKKCAEDVFAFRDPGDGFYVEWVQGAKRTKRKWGVLSPTAFRSFGAAMRKAEATAGRVDHHVGQR